MIRFLCLLLFVGGCSGCTVDPFGSTEDDSALTVEASIGTSDFAPIFSWTPVDATSVWVTDESGQTIWGIEAGGRSLPEGRYERVLIPSPVAYAAFADRTGLADENPRTTTLPGPLVPGENYTVNVMYLGGGSGGFTGRRPIVRSGSAPFTVAVPIGGND